MKKFKLKKVKIYKLIQINNKLMNKLKKKKKKKKYKLIFVKFLYKYKKKRPRRSLIASKETLEWKHA